MRSFLPHSARRRAARTVSSSERKLSAVSRQLSADVQRTVSEDLVVRVLRQHTEVALLFTTTEKGGTLEQRSTAKVLSRSTSFQRFPADCPHRSDCHEFTIH